MADSSKKRLKELSQRIGELDRIVGQKQLNIDFLEKMIELAKDEYGIHVKKTQVPQTINWFIQNIRQVGVSMNTVYEIAQVSRPFTVGISARRMIVFCWRN